MDVSSDEGLSSSKITSYEKILFSRRSNYMKKIVFDHIVLTPDVTVQALLEYKIRLDCDFVASNDGFRKSEIILVVSLFQGKNLVRPLQVCCHF